MWFIFITQFAINLSAGDAREVVVYCALDEPYAEPILKAFEKETGIRVKTIYDSEAVKTAGLVNRLIAESKRPLCDVFWNNEKLRTVMLAQKGLLEKYEPAAWKERKLPHDEKNGLWSEFAGRVRVMVYNTKFKEQIFGKQPPYKTESNIGERIARFERRLAGVDTWLLFPELKGKIAFASPLFGTTSTQFLDWMAWRRQQGKDVEKYLKAVVANKPLICAGNSDVVRRVASGQAWLGFTDSDDVLSAQSRGEPVDYYFSSELDYSNLLQRFPTVRGPLLIPNTVALLHAATHRKEAEQFVDFLLTEETELALAKGPSKQIPLGEIRGSTVGGNNKKSVGARGHGPLPFSLGPHQLGQTRGANEEELIKTMEADFELLRQTFR